jgi:hypothetical protein
MDNTFQTIVMSIAIILLIITLIIIGVSIYNTKSIVRFPPVSADCPDYWLDESNGNASKCVNSKNLGSCNVKTMDFSTSMWSGNVGLCNKAKWAKACDLTWDGVTNSSVDCQNVIGN